MLLTVAPRRLQQHAPTLVGILLILAMSVSLAWQTVGWMRLLRAPAPTVSAAPATVQAMPALEQLAALFGPSRPAASDAAPPATDLRLTLVGSFVHADPQRSSAIVQREGGKPQRYTTGSELERGIRLHGVYRDRIELERNGRLETLLFPTRSQAQAGRGYSPPSESAASLDQLDNLEEENAALLRERMEALRQQMEAGNPMPGAEPTDEPMESD